MARSFTSRPDDLSWYILFTGVILAGYVLAGFQQQKARLDQEASTLAAQCSWINEVRSYNSNLIAANSYMVKFGKDHCC